MLSNKLTTISNMAQLAREPLHGCARCGGDHPPLDWKRFARPVAELFQYWTVCPITDEPILLMAVVTNAVTGGDSPIEGSLK